MLNSSKLLRVAFFIFLLQKENIFSLLKRYFESSNINKLKFLKHAKFEI